LGSGKYSDVVFETQVCMAITFPGHNSINWHTRVTFLLMLSSRTAIKLRHTKTS
jgi:hypothetical protein